MRRLSKRDFSQGSSPVVQFKYIDRPVDRVEVVEKEVVREVEVAGQTVIIQQEAEKVDLQPLHDKHEELNQLMLISYDQHRQVASELEMQRRALVAIKAQRDIDRSRRLMLLKRLKKQSSDIKKQNSNLKLAVVASLLLSILAMILR